MKFFIDTANLDQIREAAEFGVLDGVTTNPSLMAKEGISGDEAVINHYKAICEIVDGDVSAALALNTTTTFYQEPIFGSVIPSNKEDILRLYHQIASRHQN